MIDRAKLTALANISVSMEQCPDLLQGNVSCIDPETDAANEAWVLKQLQAGNDWAWCDVTVTAEYLGVTGRASLCECSYRCEADFLEGGYYSDLVDDAVGELLGRLEVIQAGVGVLVC